MASITLDKMQELGFERRIHLADFLYQIHNEMMTKSIIHAKNLSFHFARIIFDV